jgi:hypothetical protein
MKLINNASLVTDAAVTENSLKTAMMAMPEMKAEMIQQYGQDFKLPLLAKTIGLGRAYNPNMNRPGVSIAKGINETHADQIYWSVMTNAINTFTVVAYGAGLLGSTANNTAYTMTLDVSWLSIGMNIEVPTSGGLQIFNIQSAPTANAGNYDYDVKFVSDSSTSTVLAPLFGVTFTQASVAGGLAADCGTDGVETVKQFPDVYTNFTVNETITDTICKGGITTKTWFELEGGVKVWEPEEEKQMWRKFLTGMEVKAWRGVSTYQTVSATNYTAVNTPYLTDANGNKLKSGSGILNQMLAENTYTLSLASITQQINDATTLQTLSDAITDWKIRSGFDGGDVYLYTGAKGKALLDRIFKGFADLSGGGVSVTIKQSSSETGKDLSFDYSAFSVCGVRLLVTEVSIFDNPQLNTDYTAAGSGIPKTSYQMVLMTDTTLNGTPLLEVYFKGGNGVRGGINYYYKSGRVDPQAPGMRPTGSTNSFLDGYEVFIDAEWMINCNDPLRMIWFKITA